MWPCWTVKQAVHTLLILQHCNGEVSGTYGRGSTALIFVMLYSCPHRTLLSKLGRLIPAVRNFPFIPTQLIHVCYSRENTNKLCHCKKYITQFVSFLDTNFQYLATDLLQCNKRHSIVTYILLHIIHNLF